ncbi:ATP-dependent helicase HrpB [Geotalea sp. SG265]|uniref:ATP-dependent helicase HrpB n=1 Tax=Geotalea sp. SG265 TaxID=2922867 RepID=UPI001FAF1464|nr:ATP-dependent helicase HrpB [Geotalea sp. SG265]
MKRLPIDDILPQLLQAVQENPAVVLQAPPGAGKTTRVPLALLQALPKDSRIVMLEPRRLAAANAARWMAAQLGETVGKTIGYTIRFERKVSAATRVEVVTEGILTRRLQTDPQLAGVQLVIFDEFHERNLQSDLALALCRDAQLGLRPDMKLMVMSATLDGAPIAQLLGAPLLTSEGRSYPVDIRYLPAEPKGRTADITAAAIRRALAETEGDILVFLPGGGEIRRCQSLLDGTVKAAVHPLYGDLPYARQEQAIVPGPGRKIVLATNIAETSLTIEGVRVVIDSGLCRQLRFDPATGLNRLVTTRISAASAIQRAGRGGRTAPGICYRLWMEHSQSTLIPFTTPEIRSSDLSSLALELALWGENDAAALSWLDAPPAANLAEARELLRKLGALDSNFLITQLGRSMALLPVHPRLAHLIIEGKRRGYGRVACDIAALLTERDVFSFNPADRPETSDSDIVDRLELLSDWRKGGRVGKLPDHQSISTVDRLAMQLRKQADCNEAALPLTAATVGLLLALAYPDRVGQQREAGSPRYLLANGKGGTLSGRSSLRDIPFIVAVVMEGGEKGDGQIHSATTLDLGTIRKEFDREIQWLRVVAWDEKSQRVLAREEERLGALVLATRPIAPTAEETATALLDGIAAGAGLAALNWTNRVEQFRLRVHFLSRVFPDVGLPDFSADNLLRILPQWLGPFLGGVKTKSELHAIDILAPLKHLLDYPQLRFVEEQAPAHVTVPSGSSIPLEYSEDEPPVLAVKLQELFGLADTPTVAEGRVTVTLHLLSPARRPIQVTQDLRNFWNATYPQVKKELKGRYPKHPWPDDPWNAVPTRKTKPRG